MTDKELLQTIGEIDDRFIDEAAPVRRKSRKWRYIATAAAACLMILASALAIPMLDGTDGRYKNVTVRGLESALVLRWEDKTLSERYTGMSFAGREYRTRGLAIDASLLGSKLGDCQAAGHDNYTDKMYRQTFDVYEITGIQDEKLVAVHMEDQYYVFLEDGYAPPATLGQLLVTYNLAENLSLTRFTDHSGAKDKYYQLEDDTVIWQLLAECADAAVVEDDAFRVSGNYLSFTATSEALGAYKKVVYVTEDGYVKTNILDYGYVYFIGEEAAGRIIAYATDHAAETVEEPYTNFVAGTITEIGDGYILVNDGILCWDETDGIEFKVLTTDPSFSRWLKYYNFKVGDVVYVEYRGEVGENHLIDSAYAISDAIIQNGNVLIAE